MAERPIPELPMPVAVTRHLNRCSYLSHQASEPPRLYCLLLIHVSTCQHGPSRLHLVLANRPTDQPVN